MTCWNLFFLLDYIKLYGRHLISQQQTVRAIFLNHQRVQKEKVFFHTAGDRKRKWVGKSVIGVMRCLWWWTVVWRLCTQCFSLSCKSSPIIYIFICKGVHRYPCFSYSLTFSDLKVKQFVKYVYLLSRQLEWRKWYIRCFLQITQIWAGEVYRAMLVGSLSFQC